MDDLISRQAAIDICDNVIDLFRGQFGAGVLVAIKESIEELPSAQPEPLKIDLSGYSKEEWERFRKEWANIPMTVLPKQQTGKWIKLDMHRGMADHKCTACEQECYVPTCMGEPMYAFCPNCGAKMEVNNESN